MKRYPRHFPVNEHTKICSEHFKRENFIEPDSTVRRINYNRELEVVPSVFKWTKKSNTTEMSSSAIDKLNTSRTEEEEATDTASEGEGDLLYKDSPKTIS